MRILFANPNTTTTMTQRALTVAETVKSAGTELIPLTAPRGVPYIATRTEAQIGGAVALEMLAEHHAGADAAIIAAFGDPGLLAARELFDIPVVGLAEAALVTASMLGRTFAVVTFATALGPWYRECIEMHGFSHRLAGIVMVEEAFRSVVDVQDEMQDKLVDLANRAASELAADVIIFGGAPLAGLASKVRDRVGVPLVDPVMASVKQAEALVALRPRKAITGTFRRPGAKSTLGLAEALARRIEHRDIEA